MKDNELKEKIYNMFDKQVPDDFNTILSKTISKERNNKMKEKNKKQNWFWKLAITCTILIIICTSTIITYRQNFYVDSTIELDVNPSIELKVNKQDKIISCKALNDDAKEILQDMDFKGVNIDITLNAIIGSMVTKGYLSDLSNSILISVDNNNPEKAEELRQKLENKIDSILSSDKIEGSVLSQTITEKTTEVEELANKYNISLGKAKLILDIVNTNPLLKTDDLANLSIHEINVLIQNSDKNMANIEQKGTASTKSYIGKEKAQEIALNHAKVSNPLNMEIEFDTENNIILYDIEFEDDTYEYDYEINAIDGTIITNHKEKRDNIKNNNTNNNIITKEKAQEIALTNSNIQNPENLKIEYDSEDNEYNIKFFYNGYEYDYEIDATTGNITSYDREKEYSVDDYKPNNSNYISSNEAKNIALNHANITNPQRLKVELDKEDNEYSIEFTYNGYEYEYEINATTGKIISVDKERDND